MRGDAEQLRAPAGEARGRGVDRRRRRAVEQPRDAAGTCRPTARRSRRARGSTLDVVIRNLLVGHRFPGGVLDIQDTWIEVEVADATGKRLAASGLAHATDRERRRHARAAHARRRRARRGARAARDAAVPHADRDADARARARRRSMRYAFDVPARASQLPLTVDRAAAPPQPHARDAGRGVPRARRRRRARRSSPARRARATSRSIRASRSRSR